MEFGRLIIFLFGLLAFSCVIPPTLAPNTSSICSIENVTCSTCIENKMGSCFFCGTTNTCEELSSVVTNVCSVTEANLFFCELQFLYLIIIACVVVLLICGMFLTCCIICCVCMYKCRSSIKVNRDDREQLQLDAVNDKKAYNCIIINGLT